MRFNIDDWQIATLICDYSGRVLQKNSAAQKIHWLPKVEGFLGEDFQKNIFCDSFFGSFFYHLQQVKVFFLPFQKKQGVFYLLFFQKNEQYISINLQETVLEKNQTKIRHLQNQLQQAKELLHKDDLTGLYNRNYWCSLVTNFAAGTSSFCLLLIDLDHFKSYNDRYGHLAGDRLLQEVSTTIKKNIRHKDIAIRYGGDEFLVIATNSYFGELIAQKLSKVIAKEFFNQNITASIGVASFPRDAKNLLQLFEIADKNLYLSKKLKIQKCK